MLIFFFQPPPPSQLLLTLVSSFEMRLLFVLLCSVRYLLYQILLMFAFFSFHLQSICPQAQETKFQVSRSTGPTYFRDSMARENSIKLSSNQLGNGPVDPHFVNPASSRSAPTWSLKMLANWSRCTVLKS